MKTISTRNLFTDGKVLNNQLIKIKDGRIVGLSQLDTSGAFDFENLAPALIDLHINGGEEFHFTCSPNFETLEDIDSSAQKNGIGYTLPALITSSFENIEKGINAVKQFVAQNPEAGILGLHLEGPFISKKKRGAHLEKFIQKPDLESIKKLKSLAGKVVKMVTIAPEEFDEISLNAIIETGLKLSVGHSNATFEEAQFAFSKGINLVTHLFNAMSAFGHRSPGLIGASLYNENVFSPIILDDVHLSRKSAEIALRLKKEKLFLISDALFQNRKKNEFKWDEFDAKLVDGNYVNSDGNLAGATISLADAVKNAVDWLNIPTEKAIEMATSIPANIIETNRKIGSISPGFEAKFCTFSNDLTDFKLIK